jgi:hypothetical protein
MRVTVTINKRTRSTSCMGGPRGEWLGGEWWVVSGG